MKPKKTLILHIGMHKTATTSIQNSLKGFSDGVTRYARVGHPNPNHSLACFTLFSRHPETHKAHIDRGHSLDDTLALRDSYREALIADLTGPEPRLVISGEDLAQLSPDEVRGMKAFFDPYCGRYHPIAYIRDPLGLASSLFQQIVRGGGRSFTVPLPRYRQRFGKYVQTFGPKVIEFVRFSTSEFRNGCVITDFCDRVAIDAARVPKWTGNESLSAEAVALMFRWNRQGTATRTGSPQHVRARLMMVNLLSDRFPGRFRFGPGLVRGKIDMEDCAWMEKLTGFELVPPPTTDTGKGTGDAIATEAELEALADRAAPALAALLEAEAVPAAAGSGTAAMMDALYTALVDRLRAARPAPA